MTLNWSEIIFVPDPEVAQAAASAWQWLVPGPWTIVATSTVGGLFLETAAGDVHWLECSTGLIEKVADSATAFHAFLGGVRDDAWSSRFDEWFLPSFVEQLHAAGKIAGSGQCYGFTILPVFEGGTYSVENAFVVPAREWLVWTGAAHEQLRHVPDGGQVRMRFVD